MASESKDIRVGRKWVAFLAGIWVIGLAMVPFLGFGVIPTGPGAVPDFPPGTRPSKFVGLWVRDVATTQHEFDEAFHMSPDGFFFSGMSMATCRWRVDADHLFTDYRSMCGNCYRGIETSEYKVALVGKDKLEITNVNPSEKYGLSGRYQRVEMSEALRTKMTALTTSKDAAQQSRANSVLEVMRPFMCRESSEGCESF